MSLLASAEFHRIEPFGCIRDLFCLLPNWPRKRALELAPAYWEQTLEETDAQQRSTATSSDVSLWGLTRSRLISRRSDSISALLQPPDNISLLGSRVKSPLMSFIAAQVFSMG